MILFRYRLQSGELNDEFSAGRRIPKGRSINTMNEEYLPNCGSILKKSRDEFSGVRVYSTSSMKSLPSKCSVVTALSMILWSAMVALYISLEKFKAVSEMYSDKTQLRDGCAYFLLKLRNFLDTWLFISLSEEKTDQIQT